MRFTQREAVVSWKVFVSLHSLGVEEERVRFRKSTIFRYLRHAKIDYSLEFVQGGYVFENGLYVKEISAVFDFVGGDQRAIEEFASLLREEFNQESVLVSASPVERCFFYFDAHERAAEVVPSDEPCGAAAWMQTGRNAVFARFLKEGMATEARMEDFFMHRKSECAHAQDAPLEYDSVECFEMYIGLEPGRTKGDDETKVECAKIVVGALRDKRIAYSVSTVFGGFNFEDGTFFEQDSLKITLNDVDESQVRDIAQTICQLVGQEVAMITKSTVESCYITA